MLLRIEEDQMMYQIEEQAWRGKSLVAMSSSGFTVGRTIYSRPQKLVCHALRANLMTESRGTKANAIRVEFAHMIDNSQIKSCALNGMRNARGY